MPKSVLGEDDPPDALERFDLVEPTFPARARSRRLSIGAFGVGWRNPTFLLVPAVLNLLLFAANSAGLRPDEGSIDDVAPDWNYWELLTGHFRGSLSVVLVLTLFFLLAAFYKVPKSASRWSGMAQRIVAGAAHTAAQVLAHGCVAWLSIAIVDAAGFDGFWFIAGVCVLVFLLGGALGSLVFGAYLVVALLGFGRHANEAFSASRYEGYKNFLRLHISEHGVTVYAIGIEQACHEWEIERQPASDEASYVKPKSGTIATALIEPPFTI